MGVKVFRDEGNITYEIRSYFSFDRFEKFESIRQRISTHHAWYRPGGGGGGGGGGPGLPSQLRPPLLCHSENVKLT